MSTHQVDAVPPAIASTNALARLGGGPVFHKFGKTVAYTRAEVRARIDETARRSTMDVPVRPRC